MTPPALALNLTSSPFSIPTRQERFRSYVTSLRDLLTSRSALEAQFETVESTLQRSNAPLSIVPASSPLGPPL